MEKIIKVNKINSEQQKQNSDSRICPIVKKGDVLIFDFSSCGNERVLLLYIVSDGKRIRFGGDDKLFLGSFPSKNNAKMFTLQIVIFLEKILGVRMGIAMRKERIIAVVDLDP